jgi:hypothetical protein
MGEIFIELAEWSMMCLGGMWGLGEGGAGAARGVDRARGGVAVVWKGRFSVVVGSIVLDFARVMVSAGVGAGGCAGFGLVVSYGCSFQRLPKLFIFFLASLGHDLGFALEIGRFGFFEDIFELFAGGHDFIGFIDNGDGLCDGGHDGCGYLYFLICR